MSAHPTGLQEVEIPALTREMEAREMWSEVVVAAASAAASWSPGLGPRTADSTSASSGPTYSSCPGVSLHPL